MKKTAITPPIEPVLLPTRESSPFGGLMILSSAVITIGVLFQLAPAIEWPLRVALTAFILLTLIRWGSILVLIAVQLDLLLREPRHAEGFQGLNGVLTVFLIAGLLMFINRNRDLLRRSAGRSFTSFVQGLVKFFQGDHRYDATRIAQDISRIVASAIRGMLILIGCTFASRILLGLLPDRRTLNNDLQTWMMNESSVLMASLLLILLIAAWIVLNEISWRQLTREQARLYLRSEFLTIHHADLRMIITGRLKMRRKAMGKHQQLKSHPDGLNQKNYAGKEQ